MIPSSKCIGKCNTADAVFLLNLERCARDQKGALAESFKSEYLPRTDLLFDYTSSSHAFCFVVKNHCQVNRVLVLERQQQKLSICLIIFLHKSLNKFPKGRARWLFSSFLVSVGTWNFCLKGAVAVVSMSKVLLPFVKERKQLSIRKVHFKKVSLKGNGNQFKARVEKRYVFRTWSLNLISLGGWALGHIFLASVWTLCL